MARKWYDSQIVKIEDASSTTRRFWLNIPTEESFDFRAGQFITMDLPIGEKRRDRWRSYSIASSPQADLLELCIVKLEGGKATSYLFDEGEVGMPIRFKGPEGMFVLPEEITTDLVFICTGTGVAPFRSMIQDLLAEGQTQHNIHLIFGTRQVEGILYREEFEVLAQQYPNFSYSVALSREKELEQIDYNFPIQAGYVHGIYEAHYGQVRPDVRFYLCGWSNMVDEARQRFVEMGYEQQQVVYELYG